MFKNLVEVSCDSVVLRLGAVTVELIIVGSSPESGCLGCVLKEKLLNSQKSFSAVSVMK